MNRIQSQMAIRIVNNEKLICRNCLISGPFDYRPEEAIYCHLESKPEIRARDYYCMNGLWLINGEVLNFKEAFQKVYNKDNSIVEDKEIKI